MRITSKNLFIHSHDCIPIQFKTIFTALQLGDLVLDTIVIKNKLIYENLTIIIIIHWLQKCQRFGHLRITLRIHSI